MRGKAMQVCHHKKTIVGVLHTHIITDGTEIISEVQEACAPDAAHDDLFHKGAKIR